jgi:hypothetical protein
VLTARRIALLVAALLIVAVIAAVLLLRSGADRTTTVDVDDVVREESSSAARAQDPGLRPEPGVYTYEGEGSESVTALGGASHEFGPELAARVTLGEGCEWTIELLHADEHTSTSTLCTTDEGVRLLEVVDETTFFGMTETVTTTCRDAWLQRRGDAAGTTRTWTCSGDERTTRHALEVVSGPSAWTRGAEPVADAVRTRDSGTTTGASTGTSSYDETRAPSGLPLAFTEQVDVRSESPLGDVDYTLDTSWTLRSTTPR